MNLKEAVEALGGPTAAARASGINRTTICYWLDKEPPAWRTPDVSRLIDLAKLSLRLSKRAAA